MNSNMQSDLLVAAGQKWMRKALAAWHAKDWDAVCLMAPQSVELVAKAALWNKNPALLALLNNGAEDSLVKLVKREPLSTRGLKTIGLGTALGRLEMLDSDFPLERAKYMRIADIRNGAVHVGTGSEEPHSVLLACLQVTDYLLTQLQMPRLSFYETGLGSADALSMEHQETVEATVKLKMAKARQDLGALEDLVGRPEFERVTAEREQARFALSSDDYAPSGTSMDVDCPECGSKGRLFGEADADLDVDWDVEKVGDGEWEQTAVPYWTASFDPAAFACSTCRLELFGRDELGQASLPDRRFEVEPEDLNDPSFSYDALIRAKY